MAGSQQDSDWNILQNLMAECDLEGSFPDTLHCSASTTARGRQLNRSKNRNRNIIKKEKDYVTILATNNKPNCVRVSVWSSSVYISATR
jgi:hypothetical protein